jgi:hypothetical protein
MIKATILKIAPIGYENIFAGNYEENEIPEDKISVSSSINQDEFIKPIWNGLQFVENSTQQEIEEQKIKETLLSETEKYIKRQQDGVQAYAEISAEFRLAKLNGIMTEASQVIIEKILIPVRNEVLAGQWISAKNELELIGDSNIGADLYNRLHFQISNYILLNY